MIDTARLHAAYDRVRRDLLAERATAGHWIGQLSSSALSTATAVSALTLVQRNATPHNRFDRLIAGAIRWLAGHQNADGGWGDTDRSNSNIATTILVRAALQLAGQADEYSGAMAAAQRYIDAKGSLGGLRARYGRDRTFAVPILTNAALAGQVGWSEVWPLPFELACLPQRFYRFVRLPVVSYAIPALVAIGQARHFHQPSVWPWMRWLRRAAVEPSLRVLQTMQPDSGGYLEAAPLTCFVVMSLAATGRADHVVTQQGVKFLQDSVRPDGSWPIDTNLATWTTTLAINALASGGEDVGALGCLDWLLSCQHQRIHAFTGAAPGAWGWSDLSGAVPDADDTPGALLALAAWRDAPSCSAADHGRIEAAAAGGIRWLLALQNRDGGWPTFCRGWGKLPFDRSGADLTAHALRAFKGWESLAAGEQSQRSIEAGFRYLARQQRPNDSWVPLWFGNQNDPHEENPVYGTARVLLAYRDWQRLDTEPARRAVAWLCQAQNADGGWGGDGQRSSVEETAVAVEALAGVQQIGRRGEAFERGVQWLVEAVEADRHRDASPIGFYFAKLWYYERLYPLLFTLAALGQARRAATG
jgi:squalene-hopene/tetraprenyl-beta-curcumene cyclase